MDSSFITSARQSHQFPEHPLAEIAFVGKSNSGKSSLINSLVGRKSLARKSSKPGSTVMINFYQVALNASCKYMFVDLPGYGYSKTQKSLQSNWSKLAGYYFERDQVQKVLFLFDIRRDIESYEIDFIKNIYRRKMIDILCILTKSDKVSAKFSKEKELSCKNIFEKKFIKNINIKVVSSLKNTGIKDLREEILAS
jgi:GTP-binding protein